MSKTVFYASVGSALALYDLDIAGAALEKRGTLTLPANIQYLWPHPSRRHFYVVSSTGGPGIAGDAHFASALAVDPATGEVKLHGESVRLPSRPIHTTVDASGEFLLTAFNIPSNITVHRLNADGTIGALVPQTGKLDTGIFPTTEQGLQALRVRPADVPQWNGPYLPQDIPKDPWGTDYAYRFPGEHVPDEPEIISYGADRQPGGEGIYADIVSWKSGK